MEISSPLPSVLSERLERAFGRLERSDLRADGKGRPLVGFPEKPLAVENDAVGVLHLGTYEILARHGSKPYLDRRFYRLLHSRFPNRKIFSSGFVGKHLRLQAAGNKSNQSNKSNRRFAPILGRDAPRSRWSGCSSAG